MVTLLEQAKKTRGGKREGAGRKAIGSTKSIKLTLSNESWEWIDSAIENGHASTRSEFLRNIVEFARK